MKILSSLLLILLLTVGVVVYVQRAHAFGATSVTLRVNLIQRNTAGAVIANFGLDNGMYSVYADVADCAPADSAQGAFANEGFLPLSRSDTPGPLNIIISPNGTRVAVPTSDGISVHDAHTGGTVSRFTAHAPGEMPPSQVLTFSADASMLASAHGKRIYVSEPATGKALAMLEEHPILLQPSPFHPIAKSLRQQTAPGQSIYGRSAPVNISGVSQDIQGRSTPSPFRQTAKPSQVQEAPYGSGILPPVNYDTPPIKT